MKMIIKLFLELFRKFPLHFFILFGAVFIQALLSAATVVTIAPVTDILLGRSGEEASAITVFVGGLFSKLGIDLNLLSVFILFGCLTIMTSIMSVATRYAVLKIKYDVLYHLLTDTLKSFFRARYLFFSQGDMGVLLNSFQQEVSKIGDTFGHMATFLADILQVCIFLTVPFCLSPKMTGISLFFIGLFTGPLWFLQRFSYSLGKGNTETANKCAGVLHEILTAAKLILGFGRQREAVLRYQDSYSAHASISVKFQTLQAGIGGFFLPLGIISILIALYIAYLDGTPFSDMALVMFAFIRLMPVMAKVVSGKTAIQGFVPAYEQLDRLRKDAISMEESKGELDFLEFKESIRFQNVFFSYPGRKPALNGVNLEIRRGKMVALVGESGAGKTTIIDLILGLHLPDKGQVLLDGKALKEYNLNSYRDRVGYVPQEPQLFNTSIKENFLWAFPGATDDDIWRACRLANIEQFVSDLHEQLDTVLGDRGVRVSGGQRQRLALARAIVRKPDFLVLDEATSVLDSESEQLIQQAIDALAKEMTIIVIAHRLSTIRNADYVYVLSNGRVVEEGTYSELANNPDCKLSKMIVQQSFRDSGEILIKDIP